MYISQPIAPRRTLRIPMPAQTFSGARPDSRFLGYIANLSETGVFVQCSNPRPVGSYLCLLLQLPEAPNRQLLCSAEIVWTRGYAGRCGPCQGMGLRFIELGERAQKFLRRYCAQVDPVLQPSGRPLPADRAR